MRRGDVYYADLNPVFGSEQGGMRPVVIIQNDIGNRFSGTVIVAPVTSRAKSNLPTHVSAGDKMNFGTIILLEQIKTIDKDRVKKFMCHLPNDVMFQVGNALKVSLGMDSEKKGDDSVNNWKSIYILKASNGIIKIGISNNVEKRMKTINGMYPFNIVDVYYTDPCSNSYKIERMMHDFFEDGRYFGEWFYTNYDIAVQKLKNIFHERAEFNETKEDGIDWCMSFLGESINNVKSHNDEMRLILEMAYEALEERDEKIKEMYAHITNYEKIIKHLQKCIYTDYLKPDKEELFKPNINQEDNCKEMNKTDINQIKQHVNRKGVKVLGGKQSEAYQDASIRGSVYSDIYRQIKREYGAVSSYKSIKRKYIADLHDFIDCYEPPTILAEQIEAANSQMNFGRIA